MRSSKRYKSGVDESVIALVSKTTPMPLGVAVPIPGLRELKWEITEATESNIVCSALLYDSIPKDAHQSVARAFLAGDEQAHSTMKIVIVSSETGNLKECVRMCCKEDPIIHTSVLHSNRLIPRGQPLSMSSSDEQSERQQDRLAMFGV